MQKYEILNINMKIGKYVLHRIRALKDFADVKKGDIGGWVEKYDNLSQEGDCWVYDNAKVYGSAKVADNAQIRGWAQVLDRAQVCGNAKITDHVSIFGDARVCRKPTVSGVVWLM